MTKTSKDILSELQDLEAKMTALKTSPEFQEKQEEIKAIKKAEAHKRALVYKKDYRVKRHQAFVLVRELEAYGLADTVNKMLTEAKNKAQAQTE